MQAVVATAEAKAEGLPLDSAEAQARGDVYRGGAFSAEKRAVAESFASFAKMYALKRDTPAAHPRVGFVARQLYSSVLHFPLGAL